MAMLDIDDIFIKLLARIESTVPALANKVWFDAIPEGQWPACRIVQVGDDSPMETYSSGISQVRIQVSIFNQDLTTARTQIKAIAESVYSSKLSLSTNKLITCKRPSFYTPPATKETSGWMYHAACDLVLLIQV